MPTKPGTTHRHPSWKAVTKTSAEKSVARRPLSHKEMIERAHDRLSEPTSVVAYARPLVILLLFFALHHIWWTIQAKIVPDFTPGRKPLPVHLTNLCPPGIDCQADVVTSQLL